MNRKIWNSISFAAACTFIILTPPQPTSADVVSAIYAGPTAFDYKITNMPDFDQRRWIQVGTPGLPGMGNMYCVPASTLNLLAYVAKHGYPAVPPGNFIWQLPVTYDIATAELDDLGDLMGTTPGGGTNAQGAFDGTTDYLGGHTGIVTVQTYYALDNWTPQIQDAAGFAIQGNLVALCYGRYPYNGTAGNGVVSVGTRASGHCVSLVSANRNGNNITIGVRDPADDPDGNTNFNWPYDQSPFSTRVFDQAQQRTVTSSNGWTRQMTAMVYPPVPPSGGGSTQIALLDTLIIIGLKYGLTFDNIGSPKIRIRRPLGFLGVEPNFDQAIQLAAGTIRDALISPNDSRATFVHSPTGGTSRVQTVNLRTGAIATLLDNDPAVWRVAFGRKRELYVLTFPLPDVAPGRVKCINADSGVVNNVTASRDLFSTWCGAIAYDDATDKVLVLPGTSRMIYKLSAGLPAGEGLTGQPIPASVPLDVNFGTMAVNPVDGKIWFATPAATKVFNVEGPLFPTVKEINIAGVTSITGIDFDDAGHLFVTADGTVKEYEQTGPNTWQLVANPYFVNFPAGLRVTLPRSRTNYDPIKHPASQWTNIDPSQLADFAPGVSFADCLADIDDNRVVNIDDLLLVVNNWGAPRPNVANINESNFVDIDDLLAVINAWGPCP